MPLACPALADVLVDGSLGPQVDARAAELFDRTCKATRTSCGDLEKLAGIVPGVELPEADDDYVPSDFDPEQGRALPGVLHRPGMHPGPAEGQRKQAAVRKLSSA